MKNATELEFELEFINHLTNIGGVKQWDYCPNIRTTDALWDNFKVILEQNNQGRLQGELSITEFNQVKKVISDLRTPFEAGQFLYGVNGVSQVEVVRDSGQLVFLTVFDQSQVGAGNTVYQVVNQIKRESIVDGKKSRRFDVTLLINGLPIIQVELKKAMHTAQESLNQMKQYIAERQFTDIFSTLQILIAMTPYDIKYMSNTPLESFNEAFAFQWQNEKDASPIRSWKKFTDLVLSIPMAHDLATRYMVLDGTKNKENIKVMRPYQVYATKRVLVKISSYKFKYSNGKLGYIWHTTGSGKTITSFKTAWLASRLPNVDKVIFLVDRISLTNQTSDAYKAYDPVMGANGGSGIVSDTASVSDLQRKLKSKTDKNIIVTSIQKMSMLVERKSFNHLDENIIFIVDEAHRSTGDNKDDASMMQRIRAAIPTAGWVGYTGTPKFPETSNIFGDLLHAYTIKEAIADRNVIGFKVEFKETIAAPEDATDEDIDDNIKASVYDFSHEHVRIVSEDIIKSWSSRSNNYKYNALFTVHVGGVNTSTPRVMEYYHELKRQNNLLPIDKKLKIAASFSPVTSNVSYQLETNENLSSVIDDYNDMFQTRFDMTTVKDYTEDLMSRLNKTSADGKYLDLVLVIDQLLTGFDAPELNTLYIDRTFKGSGLIQAYSRTNRVHNRDEKPFGNVVNYRWPVQNEEEMNKAFAIYSNRGSANIQLMISDNIDDGIIAVSYNEVIDELKELITEIDEVTVGFTDIPASENAQRDLLDTLRKYNGLINKVKQYPFDEKTGLGFPLDNIDDFYNQVGITQEEEMVLVTSIKDDLLSRIVKENGPDISNISLALEHIQEITIDYDYLIELIAKMADEIDAKNITEAGTLRLEINKEISKLDSENERLRFKRFVEQIYTSEYRFESYPAPRDIEGMNKAIENSESRVNSKLVADFIYHYGLGNVIKPKDLLKIVNKHRKGEDDLNKQNEISDIMYNAKNEYPEYAIEEIANLSWINFRNEFRTAVYELAEKVKETE